MKNEDDNTLLNTILLKNGKPNRYWLLLMFTICLGLALVVSILLFTFKFAEILAMVVAKEYLWGAAYQLEISLGVVAVLSAGFAGIVAIAVKENVKKFGPL